MLDAGDRGRGGGVEDRGRRMQAVSWFLSPVSQAPRGAPCFGAIVRILLSRSAAGGRENQGAAAGLGRKDQGDLHGLVRWESAAARNVGGDAIDDDGVSFMGEWRKDLVDPSGSLPSMGRVREG